MRHRHLSLLAVARQALPSPVVGIIGAAGLFCALVPGSMLLTTSATMVAKNVVQEFRPSISDARVAQIAKVTVPVIMLITLYLTFNGGNAIVNLLLLGYAFVTQLFPSMVMSLVRHNRVTKWGAGAGMVVGAAVVAWLTLGGMTTGDLLPFLPQSWHHLNVGMPALVINVIVLVIVSAFHARRRAGGGGPHRGVRRASGLTRPPT